MDMVGQNTDRYRFERTAFLSSPIDLSKTVNLLHEQIARTVGEDNREKENASFGFGSNVARHDASYHEPQWWARREELLGSSLPLREMLRQKIRQHLDACRARAARWRHQMHRALDLLPAFQNHFDLARRDCVTDDEVRQIGD